MEPEKNLHAAVPPALLSRAQEVAQQQHISLDALVRDAMEQRLNSQELEEVLALRKKNSQERVLKPEDAESAIASDAANGLAAAAQIRKLRKGTLLPEGVTIRDLINEGRA